MKDTMGKSDKSEGLVAEVIENQTAKLPSDTYLWPALACMGVSLGLKLLGKNSTALFIGQWAAPLLLMGIYNKIVKVEGHDRYDKAGAPQDGTLNR